MVKGRVQGRGQRLAAGDEGPPATTAVSVIFLFAGLVLDHLFDNLLDVANLNEDVFGLEVGVDDAALAVQVVEAKQDLFGDLLHQRHGDTAVVPSLNQAEQVLAQYLKDHADVGAVGALVLKRVEEAHDMLAAGMLGLGLDDAVEELDLVDGRLGVVGGGTDDLEGDMLAVLVVAGQPDGGEVAPAELAHNSVLVVLEVFANLDRVVPALAVVFGILLVGGVLGGFVGGR